MSHLIRGTCQGVEKVPLEYGLDSLQGVFTPFSEIIICRAIHKIDDSNEDFIK